VDDPQTSAQVERSFCVLSGESLVAEEQQACYEHNKIVVVCGLRSQLIDVLAQQSQRLIVLLQRKFPLTAIFYVGLGAVESGAC
jgi:hypothetical protein